MRKLSEKKKAANKAKRALSTPLDKRALAKAKNNRNARLALFDYHNQNHDDVNHKPPKVVIIVPARDRKEHKAILSSIYKGSIQLKVLFVNQNWDLPFNRGAMLNIGYLEVKKLYPNDYQRITFVFHDVDSIPFPSISIKLLIDRFITTAGIVKHIFGFLHSLGGVFSITGLDFEKVGGFPNLYGWNNEDVILQERVLAQNLTIDRSPAHFVDVDKGDKAMNLSNNVPFFKAEYRIYFLSEWDRSKDEDNLTSLVSYAVETDSCNINVTSFKTPHEIQVDSKNIRVYSKTRLPSELMIKGTRHNACDRYGWFINQWNADLHGDVVKPRET